MKHGAFCCISFQIMFIFLLFQFQLTIIITALQHCVSSLILFTVFLLYMSPATCIKVLNFLFIFAICHATHILMFDVSVILTEYKTQNVMQCYYPQSNIQTFAPCMLCNTRRLMLFFMLPRVLPCGLQPTAFICSYKVHYSTLPCTQFCFLMVSYNEDHFHSLRLPLHET